MRKLSCIFAVGCFILSIPSAAIAAPDLEVSLSLTLSNALAGRSYDLSWSVTNRGDADAAVQWSDNLYLSLDATLDVLDTRVSSVARTVRLPAERSYRQSVVLT